MHRLDCTETKLRRPESPRSSSWQIRPYDTRVQTGAAVALNRAAQQAQLGDAAGTSSRGKRSCSKHSPMIGITCSSTNLRDRILHQPLLVAEHAANVVQIERIELGGGSGLGGVRGWRTWRFSSTAGNDNALSGPAARRSVRGHENRGSMARRIRREPSQPREQDAALDLRAGHRRQPDRAAVVVARAAQLALDLAAAELGHCSAGRCRAVLRRDVLVARARHGAVRRRGARCPSIVAADACRGRCGSCAWRLFVVAWIGQFIGHHYEGKRPSFFKDMQFLMIGPLWLLSFVYRKLRIPY